MNKQKIKSVLQSLQKSEIKTGIPLARLTSYCVGGPADFLVMPQDVRELSDILLFVVSHQSKFFIIGNGTNIIAPDNGYDGILISLKRFNKVVYNKHTLECGAGSDLSKIILSAIRNGLAGLENLSGIPGTLGGALRMNAGAHGSEIADHVDEIQVMNYDGSIVWMRKDQIDFSYRKALHLENKIILKARFNLEPGNSKTLMQQRQKIIRIRKQKQPWDYPSAGSVFRRPKGYYAGTLISQAGLAGYRIGGAEVSSKHAGFIVNRGKATASDVITLIKHVQQKVYEKFNVKLELEQIILE